MSNVDGNIIQEDLQRRDKILGAITGATELFLRGSLATWQDNVLQVIRMLGHEFDATRIYLCKHEEVTEHKVVTGVRYEWIHKGDQARVEVTAMQKINMQEAGYGRWAGMLYHGNVIQGKVSDLPISERGWFMSPEAQTIIVVPVFVEDVWWGFITIEDYVRSGNWTQAEVDAIKTLAVTFGAAIRRKRAEEELQREKAFVEQKARETEDVAKFPEQDPQPVLRASKNGVVIYGNKASQPLLKFWNIEIGQPLPDQWKNEVLRVFGEKKEKEMDVEFSGKILAFLFVPIEEGDYVNLYGRDVSQERRAEEMKTTFLSMASHQLRTPLTALRWSSERLLKKKENLSEQQVGIAETIHDTSVRLARLVDDLLSISRIERGKMDPKPIKSDLIHMLDSCQNELGIEAEKQEVELVFNKDVEIGEFMFDDGLIRQVYLNLLSNAIKYTLEGGKVTTTLKFKDEDTIQVDVSDNGIGIPDDEQKNVFERFFRSQKAIYKGIEGTGLGLSVAKMVVEKSGGRIWFKSVEDEGATFSFTLPYKQLNTNRVADSNEDIEAQNSAGSEI